MKRNRTLPLALVTFAALTFASNAAWANHHWGNNNGMGNQGYSQLTQEQQATVQKLHNDYYAQTSALRQQLQSKRYVSWLQAVSNRMPASARGRRQTDKRGLIAPSIKLFTATRSYLTASFSALPETNAGTLAAAILISLPVCGLRPVRSARWFTLKVPKPTS